jgi:hypothetical protein
LGDLGEFRGKILKCVIRVGFYERRLQFMEKDLLQQWKQQRSSERILEIDIPLSYGVFEIIHKDNEINKCEFAWDPTKETGVFVKVNCISTEFTPKKHGGEKGVPFRLIIETHWYNNNSPSMNTCIDGASCQVKVFKPKGADRKHKTDKEKMLKRSPIEQQKYLPSFDCTVFTQCPLDTLYLAGGPVGTVVPMLSNSNEAMSSTGLIGPPTSVDNSAQVSTSDATGNVGGNSNSAGLMDSLHGATNVTGGNFSPDASSHQSSGGSTAVITSNTNPSGNGAALMEECKPNVGSQSMNSGSVSPVGLVNGSSLHHHQTSNGSMDTQPTLSSSTCTNGTSGAGDPNDLPMQHNSHTVNSSGMSSAMQCSASALQQQQQQQQQQSPADQHISPALTHSYETQSSMQHVQPQSSSCVLSHSADTVDSWQPLLAGLSSDQTSEWLMANRFEKYAHVFQQFTSSDLLRMSREDLMQMCEMPDAIRLYNRLHARPAGPLLTLYVCLDGQPVFRALYLSSFRLAELRPKLVRILFDNSVDCELLMQNLNRLLLCGPHEIRVLLTDEVLANLPDESMFVVRLDQGANQSLKLDTLFLNLLIWS